MSHNISTTPEPDRDTAVKLFCDTIALAAVAQGTTAIIRLLAWMDARGVDEGGFLWLVGSLGYRSAAVAAMIRETLDANTRRRQSIGKKMRELPHLIGTDGTLCFKDHSRG